MSTQPSRPEMERAYLGRDATYDGVFVLAVRTTGIFCRPSRPARKPKPVNVEFYPTERIRNADLRGLAINPARARSWRKG